MRQTLKKHERLHGKSTVDKLFLQGKSLLSHPFLIYYQTVSISEKAPTCAVLFSVSKKKFRLSVQRNLVKRRLREAYRKSKAPLYEFIEKQNISINFAFIYIKNEIEASSFFEKNMTNAIKKIIKDIEKAAR